MKTTKNTLVLLEDWKAHYLKKNIGINIQLHKTKIYIYCNKVVYRDENFYFIEKRVSKYKQGIYYSLLRYIKTFHILIKYQIDDVNWGYISDDELFIICLFKLFFRPHLRIYVKTDSEDITSNRSFRFKKKILEHIDRIFVENDKIAQLYRDVFVKPKIITLFNPSIFEFNKFSKKTCLGVSRNLLFVGRISPEKNILGMLKIFERYASDKPDRSLKLVLLPENDAYMDEVNTETRRLIVEGYKIQAFINPPLNEMHSIYVDSDILCITSTIEGVPNVLSDAFYIGLPVISYRVGNIPFILSDENLLCNDEEDFVNKLELLSFEGTYSEIRERFFNFYEKRMSLEVFKNNLSIE